MIQNLTTYWTTTYSTAIKLTDLSIHSSEQHQLIYDNAWAVWIKFNVQDNKIWLITCVNFCYMHTVLIRASP